MGNGCSLSSPFSKLNSSNSASNFSKDVPASPLLICVAADPTIQSPPLTVTGWLWTGASIQNEHTTSVEARGRRCSCRRLCTCWNRPPNEQTPTCSLGGTGRGWEMIWHCLSVCLSLHNPNRHALYQQLNHFTLNKLSSYLG